MTYVVPLSRAGAAVAGALNVGVFLGLLTGAGVGLAGWDGPLSAGSWAIVALWVAAAAVIFAWNHRQVRRRCYLVTRLSLLPAPAGGYPVRPRRERR